MTTLNDELLKKTEGELTTRRAAELDEALQTSPELQAEQRKVEQLLAAVSAADPALENVDLREGLWARPVPERRSARWPLFVAVAAVAAGLALFIAIPSAEESRFHPKGGDATSLSGVKVLVFPRGGGAAMPLGDTLHRDDALGFGYRNQPDSKNRALAIYAVDASGRIFWFYPAWREGQAPPSSIAISTSTALIPLHDMVKHDFALGKLTLHALFTPEPISVLDVESGRVRESTFTWRVEVVE